MPTNEKPEPPIQIHGKSDFREAFNSGVEAEKKNSERTVISLGADGTPLLVYRNSQGSMAVLELEQYKRNPTAVKQRVFFKDVLSFIAYINQFKDRGTKIFGTAELDDCKFRAILDYHMPAIAAQPEGESMEQPVFRDIQPRWGNHIAEYCFPTTPEWDELLANNKQKLTQLQLIEMVERLSANFITPPGAKMLELARTLEATTEGQFKSSINTDNGDRELIFTANTSAHAGRNEKMFIPAVLDLYVRPFIRGEVYALSAFFRYRVANGGVTFEYELIKPHEFIDKAVNQVRELLTVETLIAPLFGDA